MKFISFVNKVLGAFGVELLRAQPSASPATQKRPVGDLVSVLSDMAHRGFQPRTIVDIGANRGNWSAATAEVFPAANFYLMEPIPGFESDLARFVKGRPGSRYWMAAASNEEGTANIEYVTTLDGALTSGSTIAGGYHDRAKYKVERISVPTLTLASLVQRRELPTPDLLKVDVEGYELEVLLGAEAVLKSVEVVILEVSFERFWGQPVFHEIISRMADWGYWVYDFVSFNRRPADGSLGQADVCFVRADSKLRRRGGWDE
jgi:FkbM family methyltransferase